MPKYEYTIEGKLFDTTEPFGEQRIEWYNELGAKGWEIFEISSAFNTNYTTLQVYVTARRKTDA